MKIKGEIQITKSQKILIIMLTFIVAMLVMTTISNASVTATSCTTSPATGVFGTGTNIEITFNLDKQVKGTMPNLKITFPEMNSSEYEVAEGKTYDSFTNTIKYNYIIKSGNNGKMRLEGFEDSYNMQVETEDNINDYLLSSFTALNIYADTTIARSNLGNATFQTFGENNNNTFLKIKINNGTAIEDNSFYVHLSHDKNETHTETGFLNEYNDNSIWRDIPNVKNLAFSTAGLDDLFAESGDVYIWIVEVDKQYHVPKVIVNGKKIERSQLPVGSRMKAYFFNDETSTYCYETYGSAARKVNLKIGKVTDVNILKAIRDGKSGCLNSLMEYAKKADSIYKGTVDLGRDGEITSSINLVDDEYYYVYMQLEDENGKYYTIEDVSLYQALVGETVGKNLFDYLDDKFKWNLSDDPEPEGEDPTTAKGDLPKTGVVSCAIVCIALVTIAGVSYIKTRKYKEI